MLETPHVLVGATIASKIPNPLISIPLSLASHFVLERIPHWNPHLNTEKEKYGRITKKTKIFVIIDSTLALILGISIALTKSSNFWQITNYLFCCFFAILPDIVEAPYFFLNIENPLIKKWINFQKSIQVDVSPIPGILTQLLTIIAAFYYLNII